MFSKFLSIFSFSNLTLLVALTLSTIAAWYSIVGLTAIFAAAVVPIIIMGSALELAKIVTTVWLRKYWHKCTWILKLYLVPAVIALALLTSMGIFGFLSKAHLDQAVPTGDVAAKISLLDEKIKTERDNIDVAKKALSQMDAQVDQMLGRTDTDKGAERAVQIRRQQQKERAALQNEIAKAQNEIKKLNEERAPIASELRKVEAEVGPIKYIAAFIYGDNPDQNILERAVRWVIILLVIVFDPLAIALVLAANASKDWDNEDDLKQVDNFVTAAAIETFENIQEENKFDTNINVTAVWPFPESNPQVINEEIPPPRNVFTETNDTEIIEEVERNDPHVVGWMYSNKEEKPVEVVEEKVEETVQDETPNFEGIKLQDGTWLQTGPAFEQPKELPYKKADGDYVEFEGKSMHMRVLKQMHPEFFIEEDNARKNRTNFGTEFPSNPYTGDTFVRVDAVPNRVYKYNGVRWIETNKEITDTHLSEKYLQFLVDRIATGEYDPEILTANEQDAVEKFIKNQTV